MIVIANRSSTRPRPDQQRFLDNYRGGRAGLTATPGAGKTTLLIELFLQWVDAGIAPEHILLVSYTRAASAHFRARLLAARPALANHNLDMSTIHACAHRLIKPHLERWGYDPQQTVPAADFQRRLWLERLVGEWLRLRPEQWQSFLVAGTAQDERQRWQLKLIALAEEGVSLAKHYRLLPWQVEELAARFPERFFLQLTAGVYGAYQRQLQAAHLLDFDDMVGLAAELLEVDAQACRYWQSYYSHILEDEAQDSSEAQQHLLELLSGPEGHWVRVGDPNQAIYSSFTSANPRFLRDFCTRHAHYQLQLSARSVQPIVDCANRLVVGIHKSHPHLPARQTFFVQTIERAPEAPECGRHSEPRIWQVRTRNEEVHEVIRRACRYLETYPEHSAAILTFANSHLDEFARVLGRQQIPFIDRRALTAGKLVELLTQAVRWLTQPLAPRRVKAVFTLVQGFEQSNRVLYLVNSLDLPRWLAGANAWEGSTAWRQLSEPDKSRFLETSTRLLGLYARRGAPLDVLVLEALGLFGTTAQIQLTAEALARGIAALGEVQTVEELARFLDHQTGTERLLRWVPVDDQAQTEQRGTIELCTLHSAKGREWDGVLIAGITAYAFPTTYTDTFQGELEYLTIYPEAQLKAELLTSFGVASVTNPEPVMKDAIIQERLRLLYVGMTRARRYLSLSAHGTQAPVLGWLAGEEWA
ncbi:MAG: ATP-dependent helicase [Gemmatimonadaceae bacterium]|nr:ATP-dependent helicase [Gloeobacterales cyanobacterium ES-bin-141]